MKSTFIAVIGLSGLAVVGLTSAAAADIVTVTYTGTVTSSMDPGGVFGCTTGCSSSDNPYSGYNYTGTYVFNTNLGYVQNTSTLISATGGTSQPPSAQFGNPPAPPPSPLISDVVTISNGTTSSSYKVMTTYNALIQNTTVTSTSPNTPPFTLLANVSDADGNEIQNSITSSNIPFSITQPFGPVTGDPSSFGLVLFDCNAGACNGSIDVDLGASLVNISSAVPEPSTWAMMILGFCGIGFLSYRRHNEAFARTST